MPRREEALDIWEEMPMRKIELFKDYENAKLIKAESFQEKNAKDTYDYDNLGKQDIEGIPICVRRDDKNKLKVTFIPDTHLLAIGATRSGKTTGFVIPTLNIMLNKKNKPSMVISDPKQELYRGNAQKFIDAGYDVLLLDFTNYRHSDCWNPLTKFYRLYKKYLEVEKSIEVVETENGLRNKLLGVVYEILSYSGFAQ